MVLYGHAFGVGVGAARFGVIDVGGVGLHDAPGEVISYRDRDELQLAIKSPPLLSPCPQTGVPLFRSPRHIAPIINYAVVQHARLDHFGLHSHQRP